MIIDPLLSMLAISLFVSGASPAGEIDSEIIVCRADVIAASLHDRESRRVLVAAHRGAHLRAPENSLLSIQHAVEIGADFVELDVRVTADGVPVLMHDGEVDRTTNGQGQVDLLALEEIMAFRLFGPENVLTDQSVPTLQQALALAADQLVVDLDLKTDDLESVLQVVRLNIPMHQVVFFHSDLSILSRLRELAPDAQIMPLARTAGDARYLGEALDVEIVHLRDSYASASLVAYLDELGASTWLNALGAIDSRLADGSETAADRLIDTNVDVIQTDQPERLLQILSDRDLRSHDIGLDFDAPCMMHIADQ